MEIQGRSATEISSPKKFGYYYSRAFLHPKQVMAALREEPRKLRYAFFAVLIMAVAYTLVYIFLVMGGGQPFKPWLDIPPDVYYRYNIFFLAPSMFLGWILATAVIHLLARFFSGTGSFEETLCAFGFGIGIASWSTMIHDLLTSFLGGMHIISQHDYEIAMNSPTIWRSLLWIQLILYLVWFIVLFSIGVRTVQKIKIVPSVLLGFLAFVVYQGFFFIFNR